MSRDTERELRQLNLLQERLAGFSTGDLYIAKVVSDLEGLLAELELTPVEWKDRFIHEWSQLEIAYAVSMNDQAPIPDVSDPSLMKATRNMQVLVQERMNALDPSDRE